MNAVMEGTKRLIRKEMVGAEVNKEMLVSRNKEWTSLYRKMQTQAMVVLRELHRMEGDYSPIAESDLVFQIIKPRENEYQFTFESNIGKATFVFKPLDLTGKIVFTSIHEDLFAEAITLF